MNTDTASRTTTMAWDACLDCGGAAAREGAPASGTTAARQYSDAQVRPLVILRASGVVTEDSLPHAHHGTGGSREERRALGGDALRRATASSRIVSSRLEVTFSSRSSCVGTPARRGLHRRCPWMERE